MTNNSGACRLAATLFNMPTRIARIRSSDFLDIEVSFLAEHFGVDHIISPEQEVTETLRRLIEADHAHPRYLQTVWGIGYVFVPDGKKHE